MSNLVLYLMTSLIWGSTFLAIHYQLGVVDPLWSITYRFTLASVLLVAFCLFSKRNLVFSKKEHLQFALQGFCLFSLNYIFFYTGTIYIVSGLVSSVAATIIIMNIINGRIFLGTPFSKRVIVGALIGLLGLVGLFWSEFTALTNEAHQSVIMMGIFLCAIGTFFASCGNIFSAKNHRKGLPLIQTNTFSMTYGALLTLSIALISGTPARFDFSMTYIGSLLHLSIIGSIIAFWSYLKLLGKIGPEKASYVFIFLPTIALTLSTWFEDYRWTPIALCGVLLIIAGNIIVLSKSSSISKDETTDTAPSLDKT